MSRPRVIIEIEVLEIDGDDVPVIRVAPEFLHYSSTDNAEQETITRWIKAMRSHPHWSRLESMQ